MTIETTTINFSYDRVVAQRIQAWANVPVDLTTEDEIREWLIDNEDVWRTETVSKDDIIEVEYGGLELVP